MFRFQSTEEEYTFATRIHATHGEPLAVTAAKLLPCMPVNTGNLVAEETATVSGEVVATKYGGLKLSVALALLGR